VKALKIAALVLLIFPGSCVAYYGYWSYQWDRSESVANEFCGSTTVGSDVSSAITRARAMDRRVSDGTREGQKYYVVFFPGPIFNQFICELTVADGNVASKRIIKDGD
jgi:hypothetical protein